MSEAARARIHREFETSGAEYISGDTTLRPGSRCYIVDSTDNTVDIILPDIGESVGNMISFQALYGNTHDEVSIIVNESNTEHGSGNMDADNDYLVLYNNGLQWVVLVTNVA